MPCSRRLQEYEWRLQYAQAQDSLDEVRDHLRLRTHLYHKKDREARGVAANTRAQANINRLQHKVDASAKKYRVARNAMSVLATILAKFGWERTFPKLESGDVRGISQPKKKESEGKRKLSWIWTDHTAVMQAGGDPALNEGKLYSL
jgi:hypothetical protein